MTVRSEGDSGLLPHEIDKRFVSAIIYLSRTADELTKIDLRKVPNERREAIRAARAEVASSMATLKRVRKAAGNA